MELHKTYRFGVFASEQLEAGSLSSLYHEAHAKVAAFTATPISEIMRVLDGLAQKWERGSDYWNQAFEITRTELSFSDEMIAASLDVIPELLTYEHVAARIRADFRQLERLDRFVESPLFSGCDRAFPLGVLSHVSAGNVFLGAIDSLLMGFLTKNVSVVKLSSRNIRFPFLFAESLLEVDQEGILSDKFALVHFPGGSTALEKVVKNSSHAVIAWGGEEMIKSYKSDLPLSVKFIEYGPKISFQVITKNGLGGFGVKRTAEAIASDIAMWDQAACASPQNCFVEAGVDVSSLIEGIRAALVAFPLPRGRVSDDECVEILKEKSRAQYNSIMGKGQYVVGVDFLLHFEGAPGLRASPLNRTLIIKTFETVEDLAVQLRVHGQHLQSCSYLVGDNEKTLVFNRLGIEGVMRFAHLGRVMSSPIGAPHDGKMTLVELTRIVPAEDDESIVGFVNDSIQNVPFYHGLRGGELVKSILEMPIIEGSDLDAGNEVKLKNYTHSKASGGYLFSSGGTSGNPKYSLYSHDEFSKVAELLAVGFSAQGISAGTVVANFFVAGNMWSSFLAVDQALGKLKARTLPIGGLTNPDLVLSYLALFHPEVLIGLPTQILELARRAEEMNFKIVVPRILYAGEHLSVVARSFIQKIFSTQYFGSAGYASVDAGPIGYQCNHCDPGVHHIYRDAVHLEVIDGECVVTSLIRRQMPVIRLKTGDLVEWDRTNKPCPCGSKDRLFVLRGRSNNQFHIWGCRLFLQEFESALADCGAEGCLVQLVLNQSEDANETIEVCVEWTDSHPAAKVIDVEFFVDRLFALSKDLRATHPRGWLRGRLKITEGGAGSIDRVARTGKVKGILDRR
ncbi:MAG: hypothetical protein NTV34_13055 [Proteobacteria bacterium]|nr:hypothetical protein [Pseudomonadota bacterium]